MRKIFGKVMWVGRTAATLFGLALVMALVFGVATTAIGATGGNFILGKANGATTASKLTASIAGPALTLVNNSTATAATALNISVASGKAPLKVNAAAGKATNLNADMVDGRDAPMWVVVNSDATIARQSPEVVSVGRPVCTGCGTGHYTVTFNRNVDRCAYGATIYKDSFTGTVQAGIGQSPNQVDVRSLTSDGGSFQDNTFNLIVTC